MTKNILPIILLALFSEGSWAAQVDSTLSCRIFANGMPQGELEMSIVGEASTKVSQKIKTASGSFRAEMVWGGFYEGTPMNPEIRIQFLNASGENILLESYKNVDLQRIEKSDMCCEVDNVGLRTADDVIYLSCTYEKNH